MPNEPSENLRCLLCNRIRLRADNADKIRDRGRELPLRPILHRSERVQQVLPVVLIAVGLVASQGLGRLGEHAKTNIVSKRERIDRDFDLLIRVFPLPLLERGNEFLHLALGLGLFRFR